MNHVVVADHCVFNKDTMPDVQNTRKDFYPTPIKKVGVRNVEVPIQVFQKEEQRKFEVKASFSAYVELTEDSKGINMSRCGRTIIDVALRSKMNPQSEESESIHKLMEILAKDLQRAHNSKTSYVKAKFSYPYWTKVWASRMDTAEYVDIIWETIADDTDITHLVTVENVGLSLCPCSKEMSMLRNNLSDYEKTILEDMLEYGSKVYDRSYDEGSEAFDSLRQKLDMTGFGAHNQRSILSATVELAKNPAKTLWFEDLIELTSRSFSAPIRNILKREDEKVEGEVAYLGGYFASSNPTGGGTVDFYPVEGAGPKFVEDIARDAAKQLDTLLDKDINDYVVIVRNEESIHSRTLEAVAVLTAGRNLQ